MIDTKEKLPENQDDVNLPSKATVAELDQMMSRLSDIRVEKDGLEDKVTELNKEAMRLQAQADKYMAELGREEYAHPDFGKFVRLQKWSVRNPVTDSDKIAFFTHLRERGIFEKYATVNNKSLNSYFKAEWEEAKERGEGMTFSLPGIGAPDVHETVEFKPKRKTKRMSEVNDGE